MPLQWFVYEESKKRPGRFSLVAVFLLESDAKDFADSKRAIFEESNFIVKRRNIYDVLEKELCFEEE